MYVFVGVSSNFSHKPVLRKLPEVVLLEYFLKCANPHLQHMYQLSHGNRLQTNYP